MADARKLNYLQAICEAIVQEMRRDERVFVMGQDIRSNIFGNYSIEEFGERVRNLPISEGANVGAAVGSALTGMRPVIDMTFSTFLYSGMDQIVNQAAKSRYLFGGQASVPLVIRSALFYGGSQAAHHTDRSYAMFMQVPGLKIIAPATPYDAKGLLTAAMRDEDPVMCFEDATLWGSRGEVPEEQFIVPLGVADIKQSGTDVTLVAISGGVRHATAACTTLARDGISVELIDPRTLVPLNYDAIERSVHKTGRLVIADPAPLTCSAASEIAATIGERCFGMLRAPIVRVTAADIQIPFSPPLEKAVLINAADIVEAVKKTISFERQ